MLIELAYKILVLINILTPWLFLSTPIIMQAEGDALDYRIPLIDWMIRHRQYPNLPWTRVDDYPMLIELLMLPFRILAPWGPRVVACFGYTLFVLGTHRLFKVWGESLDREIFRIIKFGVIITSTMVLVTMQDNLVMVDLIASAFTIWAISYASLALKYPKKTRFFLKFGIFSGLALATKYSMIVPIFVLMLWFLIQYRKINAQLTFIALFMILIPLPWWLRNLIINHDPIFPLGFPVFPSVGFDVQKSLEMKQELSRYGLGISVKNFLLLPYNFIKYRDSFDYSAGPHWLLFTPFIGFIFIKFKKYHSFILLLFFNVLFWFINTNQTRFLIHAAPLLVFLGVLGLITVSVSIRNRHWVHQSLLAFVLTWSSFGTIKHIHKHYAEWNGSVPPIPQMEIVKWLNQNLQPDDKVLLTDRTGNLSEIKNDFVLVYPHPYATRFLDSRISSNPCKYYEQLFNENVKAIYQSGVSYQLPLIQPGCKFIYSEAFRSISGGVIYQLKKES